MVDRTEVVEMGIAVSTVALMIVSLYLIGQQYASNGDALAPTGADAMVGAIVGFILLLVVLGVAIAVLDPDSDEA